MHRAALALAVAALLLALTATAAARARSSTRCTVVITTGDTTTAKPCRHHRGHSRRELQRLFGQVQKRTEKPRATVVPSRRVDLDVPELRDEAFRSWEPLQDARAAAPPLAYAITVDPSSMPPPRSPRPPRIEPRALDVPTPRGTDPWLLGLLGVMAMGLCCLLWTIVRAFGPIRRQPTPDRGFHVKQP